MAVTDRLLGTDMALAVKAPCVVATTGANITLSSTQVIDGIAVGAGERVLVKDQTGSTDNGIYISASSSWARSADTDGARDLIPGSLVYVDRGTQNGESFWVFNSSSTATAINSSDNKTLSEVTVTLAGFTEDVRNNLAALSTDQSSALTLMSTFSYTAIQNSSASGWRSTLVDTFASNWRTTLGLVIGTDVQAYSTDLAYLSSAMASQSTVGEWVLSQNFDSTNLTDGANIDWNGDTQQVAEVTLGGNRTMNAPSNIRDGGFYSIIVKQDGTGSRTLSWNADYRFPSGNTPTLSSSANAVDIFSFRADSTLMHLVGKTQDLN